MGSRVLLDRDLSHVDKDNCNNSIKWKIHVLNAIVRIELLHGLHCVQLTNAELSTLNAFQNKSRRRVSHIPPLSLTESRPMPLCMIQDKPLVDVLLSTLRPHGARQNSDVLGTYCEPSLQIL